MLYFTDVSYSIINQYRCKKNTINVSEEADKQNKLIDKLLLCSQSHEYPVKNNHKSLCAFGAFDLLFFVTVSHKTRKKTHNTTRCNAMQHR